MSAVLGALFAVVVGGWLIADIGCTMFMIPAKIIDLAKKWWFTGYQVQKIIAVPLCILGKSLLLLAQVFWYGVWCLLATGLLYMCITGIWKFIIAPMF